MTQRALVRWAVLSSLALAALTALVAAGATRGADLALLVLLQRGASYPLDVLANAHTYVGLSYVSLSLAVLASFVLLRRGRRAEAGALLFIFATGPIELALKLLLSHPGPPEEYWRTFAYLGTGLHTPSSFPSGAVSRLGFLCAFAALAAPRAWVITLSALALAVTLWARVYIGDHWPSDAVGGALLGTACASTGLLVARARTRTRPSRG